MKIFMKMQENWVAVFFCFTRKTVKYYKMNGKVGYPPLNLFLQKIFSMKGERLSSKSIIIYSAQKNRCFLGKQLIISPYWKEIFGGTLEKNKNCL